MSLGLNNSKLFAWLLYKFIYSNVIRSTRYDGEYVARIPVPDFESVDQSQIISLVNQLIARGPDVPAAASWQREIDQLVYQIYGSTAEDIGLVEGK